MILRRFVAINSSKSSFPQLRIKRRHVWISLGECLCLYITVRFIDYQENCTDSHHFSHLQSQDGTEALESTELSLLGSLDVLFSLSLPPKINFTHYRPQHLTTPFTAQWDFNAISWSWNLWNTSKYGEWFAWLKRNSSVADHAIAGGCDAGVGRACTKIMIDSATDLCNLTNPLFAKQTKLIEKKSVPKNTRYHQIKHVEKNKRNAAWFLWAWKTAGSCTRMP